MATTIHGLSDTEDRDDAKHTLMALNAAVIVLHNAGDHWSAEMIEDHLIDRSTVR